MEAGRLSVVRHLDLCAEGDKPIQWLAFGGARVHGGDDAQRPARSAVRAEGVSEHPQAVPADEGAEQVDAVRGGNLVRECVREGGFAASVDEQVGGRQGNERCRCCPVQGWVAGSRLDAAKLAGGRLNRLFRIREQTDDAVGDRDLTLCTVPFR